MRRRDVIAFAASALLARPFAALAQQPALPVIGFLNSASAEGYGAMAAAFKQGLKEAGFTEGENVAIEYRWADNVYDRLPALAAELVSRRVSVIVANSPSIAPAEAATKTIPITFLSGDDPVRLGFVASLAKPGGNATGVTIFSGGLAAKRLGLLRDLVPQAKVVAVLINTDWPAAVRFQADVEAAASAIGLPVRILKANNEAEIDDAFTGLAQNPAGALLVGPGPFFDSRRDKLVALAAKAAIPAGYETRATAVAGGLVSYGASVADGYRQVGVYTGRVLKGENPAEMPVMQPIKFEFVINLQTAKTLGLSVPANMLTVADEVIE
jgi:putative tryptophan/tyrosine transport system substrate-binding protein